MKFFLILYLLLCTAGPVQAVEEVEVRLIELTREQLSSRYPEASFNIELRWLPARLGEIPAGDIQGVRIKHPELPRALVSAEVLTGGETYPVQFYIRTLIQAPVLQSPVSKDEVIRENMVKLKLLDVTKFRQLPVANLPFGEITARVELPAGEPIYRSDLSSLTVVERGKSVVMEYRMNGLQVELNCEARQSGGTGELITVRCPETGKRYEGKVRDENTVMWRKTL